MKVYKTERGFYGLNAPEYPDDKKESRVLQESSAIGDCDDSIDRPGSSYLWIGENHHLDREDVKATVGWMLYWLIHKRLPSDAMTVHCDKIVEIVAEADPFAGPHPDES